MGEINHEFREFEPSRKIIMNEREINGVSKVRIS